MSEDVPSFSEALNMIKRSRSECHASNSFKVNDNKEKIVYEIPDLNEHEVSCTSPIAPTNILHKSFSQPAQSVEEKIKKPLPAKKDAKQTPFLPPRPQEKVGKHAHKPILPTPIDPEPIEKVPVRLAKMPKYAGKHFKVEEFAKKLAGQFPIAVKVSRGFYGDSELYTLSEGEKFIVCFLTDYETVCGVDPNGSIFEIPINDSHLVTLLSEKIEFDPRTQENITSLLSLNPTPRRVAARNNFTRDGVAVKIGDLLEIISINYDEDSGQPLNVIFRTMQGRDVHLTEHDTEQFSLRLSLTSDKMQPAMEKCIFPQRVYLHPQQNNRYTSNNKPYTLLEKRRGQMLVTYVYEDKVTYVGIDDTADALVEIPLDLDIELEILGKPENKTYETKEEIYSAYKDVRKFIRKEEDYGVIANYVRKGKHVELPEVKSSPGMAFLNNIQTQSMASPSTAKGGFTNKEMEKMRKDLEDEKKRNEELERLGNKLDDINKSLREKCETKERYIKELLAERNLPPLPRTDQHQQQQQKEQHKSYSESDTNLYMEADGDRYSEPKTILQQSENKPIKQLDDYSVQDVKELLNSLNLSQYTNKFVEEGVNGEILSVLDSSILENDLGVTSGLHKKKILKIVEKLIHQQDISHYMCLDSFRVPPAASEDVYQEL